MVDHQGGEQSPDQKTNGSVSTSVARDQLRSVVERVERLAEEKKAIADDIKDVYAEAKGNGFDTKTLRKIVAMRKLDVSERQEQEAMLDMYASALGMIQPAFDFDAEPDPEPVENVIVPGTVTTEPDDDGDVLDAETGELVQAEPVPEPVPRDKQIKNAALAGAGAFSEHGDRDQNPYFEEGENDLREAWNAGFQNAADSQVEDVTEPEPEPEPSFEDDGTGPEPGPDYSWLSEDDDQPVPVEVDPNQPADETPISDAWEEGMQARKEGSPKSDNPYEPGQDQMDWNMAYETADRQIGELFRAGQGAAEAGKPMTESGFRDGTFENDTWEMGWTRWHQQNGGEGDDEGVET